MSRISLQIFYKKEEDNMDKKPTWYDLQAMEVMDVMLKGENAKRIWLSNT